MRISFTWKGQHKPYNRRMQGIPKALHKWTEWKYQLVKEINACFKFFGNHQRQNCPSKERCNCNSTHHHKLLCEAKPRSDNPTEEAVKVDKKGSYVAESDSLSLYPIYQVPVSDCNKSITVFCDRGSNATYITHRAAQQVKARKLGKVSLEVTTMRNVG